jgi:hypothetical protein
MCFLSTLLQGIAYDWEAPCHRVGNPAITRASLAALVGLSYIYLRYLENLGNRYCGTFWDIPGHREP